MSSILPIIAPTIVSATLILVSLYASKNASDIKIPKGLINFLEVVVIFVKSVAHKIDKSKFLKTLLPILVAIYLIAQVLVITPLWSKITAPKATTSTTQKAPKIKAIKPPKTSAAKTEEGPKSVFVPYLRAGTADLNTTIALALISVIATQVIGVKFLGFSYFQKYINFKGPIDAFVGLLETISEISKIISFSFRLFGNIFAGEVLLAVIYYLLPIIVPIPFLGLEIFVGTIQAFVFATLSLVFMNLATQGHGDEHHESHA